MQLKHYLDRSVYKNTDKVILILIIAIIAFGIITLLNVTADPFTGEESSITDYLNNLNPMSAAVPQLLFAIVGFVILFLLLFIDYNDLRPYIKYFYWICVGLLVIVLVYGSTINGTSGWFKLGPVSFQPSEFTKIALILSFSKILADFTEGEEAGITKLSQLWPVLWRFLIPFLLVAVQPDFGTALVYVAIFIIILFFARASVKIFLILAGIAGGSIPLLWMFLADWQKDRLFSFLDKSYGTADTQYQAVQARLAIGSGQLTGKGLFAQGSMSQLGYVPMETNDFIFSVTTETFGFIGASLLLVLYALLIIRTIMVAMNSKDDFGTYICMGVTGMMLFHIFENIGMNIDLMPITGIPLPFFSYGGSNLLTCLIAYSFVLNVSARRQRRQITVTSKIMKSELPD